MASSTNFVDGGEVGRRRKSASNSSRAPGGRTAQQEVVQQALPQRRAEEAQLPFVMDLKRPRKMRLELTVQRPGSSPGV